MKKLYLLLLMVLVVPISSLISRESSPFLDDVNKLNENSAMRQICNENTRSLTPNLEKEVHCHYLGAMFAFFEEALDRLDKTEDKEKFLFPGGPMMDAFLLGAVLEGLGIIKQPLRLEQENDPEVQKEIEFFTERKLEILEESIKKQKAQKNAD